MNTMTRTCLVNAVMVLLGVCWGQSAWAGSLGVVESLSVQDARGRWQMAKASGEATMERDGTFVPLSQGLELQAGDRITTTLVRVEISLEKGELLQVAEGSQLVLQEGGLAQELGQIYLELRRAFTVSFGTVEATVEGTRFLVSGPDPVWVGVSEGRVRVREGEREQLVERGKQVRFAEVLGELEPWNHAQRAAVMRKTWLLGRPKLEIRVLGDQSGLASGGLLPGVSLEAEVALARGLGLSLGGGFTGNENDFRVPGNANLSWSKGGFAVSGGPVVEMEHISQDCDPDLYSKNGSYTALHIGGEGRIRGGLSLSRRVRLLAEVRVAYTDELSTDLRMGLGVGL